MKCEALQKSVERPGPPLRELCAESIASDIGHIILFRKWGNSAGRIFSVQGLTEKDEVCKAPADREFGFLKRLEVGLDTGQSPV